MSAILFCKYGKMKGVSFEIGDEAVLGRNDEMCSIVLPHKSISSRHARIWRDKREGCYYLEDLNSMNGTSLDGMTLSEPERLDRIHIVNFAGVSDFFFRDKTPKARLTPEKDPRVAPTVELTDKDRDRITARGIPIVQAPAALSNVPPPVAPRIGEGPGSDTLDDAGAIQIPTILAGQPASEPVQPNRVWVLEVELPEERLRFSLESGDNMLGRGHENPIQISSKEVSRRHAMITLEAGKVFVRDLGSTNQTYVDGRVITDRVEIKAGTALGFGKINAALVPVTKEGDGHE